MQTLRFDQVKAGDPLPDLDVPITTTIVVGGALASRDFTPVHHDRSAANAQGLPDTFMNILPTNGYVGRYVTDWAGPDVRVKGVRLKLGAPMTPGDSLKLRGKVLSSDEDIVVEVIGDNAWGNHVRAEVTIELPASEAR